MAPTDDDLNFRATAPRTGNSSGGGDNDLAAKFEKVLLLTPAKLPGSMGQELRSMLTPEAIASLVAVLVVWAGSHAIGVGFVIDFVAGFLFVLGVAMTGMELIRAAGYFMDFMATTVAAKTEQDFDRAADYLAKFIAAVGIGVFMALLTRRGQLKTGNKSLRSVGVVVPMKVGAHNAGMLPRHAAIFMQVARQTKKLVAVRWSKKACVTKGWLQKRYPAKPKGIDAKTSKETGIVTIVPGPDKKDHLKQAYEMGYYVVEKVGQRLVAKNESGDILRLPQKTEWPLQAGQIIDGKKMKPLTGDYDLMLVVDPKNPTANLTIEEALTGNSTNPGTREVRTLFNKLADDDRVMHGAHDGYGTIESAMPNPGDGIIVFDGLTGEVRLLRSVGEAKEYYRFHLKGRQTRKGSYERMAQDEFELRYQRGEFPNVTLHPTFGAGIPPKQ
ncbi:MAG: hypothetical protein MK102_18305 [Fuerstiella sp.]|nr:hypothetical protein [Fuerstiella sp.]